MRVRVWCGKKAPPQPLEILIEASTTAFHLEVQRLAYRSLQLHKTLRGELNQQEVGQ